MANPTRNNNGFGAGFVTNDMAITAILEARSTTKGVLFPRMTTTQRNAIVSPAESLFIFNTTTGGYQYYHSGVWTDFGGGAMPTLQQVATAGNETTNLIIIRQSAAKWIEIGNDGVIKFFDTDIQAGAIQTIAKGGNLFDLAGKTLFTNHEQITLADFTTGVKQFNVDLTQGLQLITSTGTVILNPIDGLAIYNADNTKVISFFEDGFNFNQLGGGASLNAATGILNIKSIPFTFNPTTGGQLALTSDIVTPTLQQVTTVGNETTNDVVVKSVKVTGDDAPGGYKMTYEDGTFKLIDPNDFVALSIPLASSGLVIGQPLSTSVFLDTSLVSSPVRQWFQNKNDATFAYMDDIVTPIAGNDIEIDNTIPTAPIINFIGNGSTISALDPIIQSYEILNSILQRLYDFPLAKDGNNANATLDLQAVGQSITGIFVKGATIEINTVSEVKKAIISGNLLGAIHNMEMPNYSGTLTTEGFVTANIKTPIAGTGITIDNSDPIYPIINAIKPVKVIFTPANGGTVNAVNNVYNIINSATLLSLTIALPALPTDGDVLEFKFINGITTVTYTGGTVAAPLTNPVIGQLVKYVYDTTNAKWF